MKKKKTPQRPNKPRHATSSSTKPLGPVMAGPAADRFWSLIARVEAASGGDLAKACAAFRTELEALDDAGLLEMNECFHSAMHRAYDYILWSAAYLMHGGCSDDGFWDFRTGLVALGRQVYERALRDPDSLADVPDVVERTLYEGFQYVPSKVLEARGLVDPEERAMPKKATREMVDEDELEIRFPALAQKFG